MSLYRDYRPGKWSEVIGQNHVVSVLEAQAGQDKIAHAYLFFGSRGVGKTSIARIFAKSIGTTPADLYEIDAASNRGIDEVRELREAVRTLPFESKYKVYIIDEVHMLTTPAFNALLKTLEEPPSHVIFILATTESHKLPSTIVSRCQTFTFERPTEMDITGLVTQVSKSEGYRIDKGSLTLISMLAEGAFRDALTILEKVMAVSKDKSIEVAEVEKVTGAPGFKLAQDFVSALVSSRSGEAITVLRNIEQGNLSAKIFTKQVMSLVRLGLLLALAPDMGKSLGNETSETNYELALSIGKGDIGKKLPNLLRLLLRAHDELAYAHIGTVPLELVVAEFIDNGIKSK